MIENKLMVTKGEMGGGGGAGGGGGINQELGINIQTLLYIFLNKFIYFIYFWLRWVFVAASGLSLVVASGGYSSLRCACFSLWWLLLLQSTSSRRTGFSSCGTRAPQLWLAGSRAQAQ